MTESESPIAESIVFGTRAHGFPSIDDLLSGEHPGIPRPSGLSVATAFWDGSIIQRTHAAAADQHGHRLLLWLDGGNQVSLTSLQSEYREYDVDVRFIGSPDASGIFHVKLYGMTFGASATWQRALVGSPNFTDAAMRSNLELAVLIDHAAEVVKLHTWFDAQFARAIPAAKLDWDAALDRLPERDPSTPRHRGSAHATPITPSALAEPPRARRRSTTQSTTSDLVELLEAASGLSVRKDGDGAVLELDQHLDTESLKRTRLEEHDGTLVLKFWPAELKRQAESFYTTDRAQRVVEASEREEWHCRPLPNLAYYNAPWQNREYFGDDFEGTLAQYVAIWRDNPSATTGAKSPKFETETWPRLNELGAFPNTAAARAKLTRIIEHSNRGDRSIQIRPTVEMTRRVTRTSRALALDVRDALIDALDVLDEPTLPPLAAEPTAETATSNEHVCVVAARVAYPVWQRTSLYWCQPGRAFTPPLKRIGFYHDRAIEPELPLVKRHIPTTTTEALGASSDPSLAQLATRIRSAIAAGLPAPEEPFDLYELTPAQDTETIRLDHRVEHTDTGRGKGFVQAQRYVPLAALLTMPTTTAPLN